MKNLIPFSSSKRSPLAHTSCSLLVLSGLFGALGCNVESSGGDTGGVGGAGNNGSCPSGVSVVLTDYVSTQIALSGLDGQTESESLISTASSSTDGLAFALSGDVVLPSATTTSGTVVLLDRYGTNVVTWVDPRSGEVLGQLPVGTGFESNPQDYVEVEGDKAWISRWGQNGASGAEDFDDGGDLLLVDTKNFEILDSVVMPVLNGFPARPGPLALIDGEVLVSLDRIPLDFSSPGEAMVVGVDATTGKINFEQAIAGRKACGRATLSPNGKHIAMACTGALDGLGEIEDISQSALLIFDAEARPLKLTKVYEAADLLDIPLQGQVTYVDDNTVLLKTQTPWGGQGNNQLVALDLKSEEVTKLLEASPDDMGAGKGLVYGNVFCAPGCSNYCLMPDADKGVLQRIEVAEDGALSVAAAVTVEEKVGLSPTGLSGR